MWACLFCRSLFEFRVFFDPKMHEIRDRKNMYCMSSRCNLKYPSHKHGLRCPYLLVGGFFPADGTRAHCHPPAAFRRIGRVREPAVQTAIFTASFLARPPMEKGSALVALVSALRQPMTLGRTTAALLHTRLCCAEGGRIRAYMNTHRVAFITPPGVLVCGIITVDDGLCPADTPALATGLCTVSDRHW